MEITRNDPCWCGSGKKWKKCHFPNKTDPKNALANEYLDKYGIVLKTQEQIEGIKEACKLAASILDQTANKAKAGVTTNELDAFAHQLHKDANATPAPLGYGSPPFPKSICTSLNEEICHGIPNDNPLKDGDILNIDVSCVLNGYYGDCSKMVMVGDVGPEKKKLVETTHTCLMNAIHICKPGVLLSEIGKMISDHAEAQGYSVVDQFVGHGVGLEFHEPPQVPHHRNKENIPLAPGMTFTIEPMINAGVKTAVIDKKTQWIAYTEDRKPSAQWEHTLLITQEGHEILTLC